MYTYYLAGHAEKELDINNFATQTETETVPEDVPQMPALTVFAKCVQTLLHFPISLVDEMYPHHSLL